MGGCSGSHRLARASNQVQREQAKVSGRLIWLLGGLLGLLLLGLLLLGLSWSRCVALLVLLLRLGLRRWC